MDELLRRYRSGRDPRAFQEFVDRTAPGLRRCARVLCGDRGTAEDLVQTTYLTFVQKQEELDLERPVMPWLLAVLSHHALNERRRRRPDGVLPDELVGPQAEPSRIVEEREVWRQLRRAVDEMPASARAVLTAVLEQDLTPAQISARLGIAPGTVRVRLHRGIAALRGRLRDWGGSLSILLPGLGRGHRWGLALSIPRAVLVVGLGLGALWWLARADPEAGRTMPAAVAASLRPRPMAPVPSRSPEPRLEADRGGDRDGAIVDAPLLGTLVSGRVRWADPVGVVEAASLYLFLEHHDGPQLLHPLPVATTGADGAFRLSRPLGMHPSGAPYLLVAWIEGAWGLRQLPYLHGRESLEVDVSLSRTARLEVRVEDERGRPLPEVAVDFVPCFHPWPVRGGQVGFDRFLPPPVELASFLRATTGADGRCARDVPLAGELTISLGPADESGRWSERPGRDDYEIRLRHPRHGSTTKRLSLRPGEDRVLSLTLGSPTEPELPSGIETREGAWRCEGRVIDDSGAPVEGCRVEWVSGASVLDTRQFYVPDATSVHLEGQTQVYWRVDPRDIPPKPSATTDEEGGFVLSVEGSRASGRLLAIPPAPLGDWWGVSTVRIDASQRSPTLVLHRRPGAGARLDVELRDPARGERLTPSAAFLTPTLEQFGRLPASLRPFEIPMSLEHGWVRAVGLFPGDWVLFVHVEGRGMEVHPFTVQDIEDEVQRTLELRPPADVHGRLVLHGSSEDLPRVLNLQRVADSLFPLWGNASRLSATLELDAEGRFEGAGLTAGTWRVECFDPPLFFPQACVSLYPGDNALELAAMVGARLEFSRGPDRLDTLDELWLREPGAPWQRCGGGVHGAFNLDLPPGHYQWRIQLRAAPGAAVVGESVAEGEVELQPDDRQRIVY